MPEARIEMTYSEFVRKCERLIADFEAQGFRVEKVAVDVGPMIEWCHRHGYEIDDTGRSCRVTGRDVMTTPFEDGTRSVQ
jgi:hypothetical protein